MSAWGAMRHSLRSSTVSPCTTERSGCLGGPLPTPHRFRPGGPWGHPHPDASTPARRHAPSQPPTQVSGRLASARFVCGCAGRRGVPPRAAPERRWTRTSPKHRHQGRRALRRNSAAPDTTGRADAVADRGAPMPPARARRKRAALLRVAPPTAGAATKDGELWSGLEPTSTATYWWPAQVSQSAHGCQRARPSSWAARHSERDPPAPGIDGTHSALRPPSMGPPAPALAATAPTTPAPQPVIGGKGAASPASEGRRAGRREHDFRVVRRWPFRHRRARHHVAAEALGHGRLLQSHLGRPRAHRRRLRHRRVIDFIGRLVFKGASILAARLKVDGVVGAFVVHWACRQGSFRPAASFTLKEGKRDREERQDGSYVHHCHEPGLDGWPRCVFDGYVAKPKTAAQVGIQASGRRWARAANAARWRQYPCTKRAQHSSRL